MIVGEKMILTFDEIYQHATQATPANIAMLGIDVNRLDDKPPFLTIAGKLAAEGYTDLAKYMNIFLDARLEPIIIGHAMAKDFNGVSSLLQEHPDLWEAYAVGAAFVDDSYAIAHKGLFHYPDALAFGFALANNKAKVKEYYQQFGARIESILEGYISRGNHEEIENYRRENLATVETIASVYARCGNDEKVEEYRLRHGVSIRHIAASYNPDTPTIPALYRAVNELNGKGEKGQKIIDILIRLKEGADSWNPYWMNSSVKLERIINAVLELEPNEDIILTLSDEQSELYQALNMSRHTPLSLFTKKVAFKQSHSLQSLEEDPSSENVVDITSSYTEKESTPLLYRAVNVLKEQGAEGQKLIEVLTRLHKGSISSNPYWMNSSKKLKHIIHAVTALEPDADLKALLQNDTSDLYKAVNMSRITPLSLFTKKMTVHQSHSFQMMQEETIPANVI